MLTFCEEAAPSPKSVSYLILLSTGISGILIYNGVITNAIKYHAISQKFYKIFMSKSIFSILRFLNYLTSTYLRRNLC